MDLFCCCRPGRRRQKSKTKGGNDGPGRGSSKQPSSQDSNTLSTPLISSPVSAASSSPFSSSYSFEVAALCRAAESGDIEETTSIIMQSTTILINECDEDGTNALYKAALQGHRDVVEVLLNFGADPRKPCMGRLYPVHAAAKCGSVPTAMLLLQAGASLNSISEDHRTPTHMAVHSGHYDMAKFLLDTARNPSSLQQQLSPSSHRGSIPSVSPQKLSSSPSSAPLFSSPQPQSKVPSITVEDVLEAKDAAGNTSLMVACELGDARMAKMLIKRGANFTSKTRKRDMTPLMIACLHGRLNVAQLLASALIHFLRSLPMDEYNLATPKGPPPSRNALLSHGADDSLVSASVASSSSMVSRDRSSSGRSGIEASEDAADSGASAAPSGSVLFSGDASSNSSSAFASQRRPYIPPPSASSASSSITTTPRKHLRSQSANDDISSLPFGSLSLSSRPFIGAFSKATLMQHQQHFQYHQSPSQSHIHSSQESRSISSSYQPSRKSSSSSASSSSNSSSSSSATSASLSSSSLLLTIQGYESLFQFLNEQTERTGETALHFACTAGHLHLARLLAELGADLDVLDKSGASPLHKASANGHPEIVYYLVSRGADTTIKESASGKTAEECADQSIRYPRVSKAFRDARDVFAAKLSASQAPSSRSDSINSLPPSSMPFGEFSLPSGARIRSDSDIQPSVQ